MVTLPEVYEYLSRQALGVLATVNEDGLAEAAVVGMAVTPDLEIVFDTVSDTRKHANLLSRPECAFVIGWDQSTVQIEGVARLLGGTDDDAFRACYYAAYPDGLDRVRDWLGLVHFVVRPTWMRFSRFGDDPVKQEWRF